MSIYETLIMMQCDGNVEDEHKDYTLGEILEMYEKVGKWDYVSYLKSNSIK